VWKYGIIWMTPSDEVVPDLESYELMLNNPQNDQLVLLARLITGWRAGCRGADRKRLDRGAITGMP
jgi:hypothetical protein